MKMHQVQVPMVELNRSYGGVESFYREAKKTEN